MSAMRVSSRLLGILLLAACTRSEPAADTTMSAGAVATRDSASSASMSPGVANDSAAGSAAAAIRTASSQKVGTYLTDAGGRSLYMFEKDSRNTSSCSGECAEEWPPFTPGTAAATSGTTSGVASAKVGSITRSDNVRQATYNGMPLYYYHDDSKPGDIEGQGKKEFGGSWYLVSPGGSRIEKGESGKS